MSISYSLSPPFVLLRSRRIVLCISFQCRCESFTMRSASFLLSATPVQIRCHRLSDSGSGEMNKKTGSFQLRGMTTAEESVEYSTELATDVGGLRSVTENRSLFHSQNFDSQAELDEMNAGSPVQVNGLRQRQLIREKRPGLP
jgi:hypothetical protein